MHRGPDGHEVDRDQTRRFAERHIAEIPDRESVVVQKIAEADVVVTRWTSNERTQAPSAVALPPVSRSP